MRKTRRPPTPLFEVRHSRIHGHGVFALRQIRKGSTIIEYLGDRVSPAEADRRYADKDPDDGHTFLFTVDGKTVIDAGVDGNEARFVNHGCEPNCQTVNTNRRIFIEALRTIRPGEELAYDYRIERDADDPADIDEVFACRCGAQGCRGSMLVARKEKPRAGKRRPDKRKASKRAPSKRVPSKRESRKPAFSKRRPR